MSRPAVSSVEKQYTRAPSADGIDFGSMRSCQSAAHDMDKAGIDTDADLDVDGELILVPTNVMTPRFSILGLPADQVQGKGSRAQGRTYGLCPAAVPLV